MPTEPLTLVLGHQQAVVRPTRGVVSSYRVAGRDVIAGAEHPDLFAYRGSLLAPWPNRVTEGRWTWEGEPLELPRNDPTGLDAALHGLVVDAEFAVVSSTSTAARLAYDLSPTPGYPFALHLEVTYALTPAGLTCALTATNTGTRPAPVGLGVHPYIAAPGLVDDVVLTLPARTAWLADEQWREVARRPVDGSDLDFRGGRRLGDRELDAAFTDVVPSDSGRVEAVTEWPDGSAVVMWSGGTCRWLLVYTGHTLPDDDRRRSLAVEPMTCGPNALASGEIDVVAPGKALTLEWGFSLR